MKVWKTVLLVLISIITFMPLSLTYAESSINSNKEQPVQFESSKSIDDVILEIDNYYLFYDYQQFIAAPGTKWGNGTKVHDGKTGYYVTNYYWVKGSSMSPHNPVGAAQRRAVINRYGSLNNNSSYKMKTTQHIVQSNAQTQGYYTASAQAWCYDRS